VTHRNHLTVRIVDHIVHIDRLLNGVLHIGGGICTAMQTTVRVFVCLWGVNVCVRKYFKILPCVVVCVVVCVEVCLCWYCM